MPHLHVPLERGHHNSCFDIVAQFEIQAAGGGSGVGKIISIGGNPMTGAAPGGGVSSVTGTGGGVPVSSAAMLQLPHEGASSPDLQYCTITLENFLAQLLKLLVCSNEKFGPQIQKHVKELVGHEMSPLLYPILFDQIKLIVETFFDGSGQVWFPSTTIIAKY